jgi:hypothetical protein
VDRPSLTSLSEQLAESTNFPQDFGYDVTWNALLATNGDWTNAINTALTNNKRVLIPKGTFKCSGTIIVNGSNKLIGLGRGISIIQSQNTDSPIISASGKYVEIRDLTLNRSNFTPPTTTNANGISVGASGFLSHSVISQVEITSNYNGIYCDNTTNLYSCTISDIWINTFKNWGMYLNPYGATGCNFDNIYINNWNDYSQRTKFQAVGAVKINNYSEFDFRQLNIEHGIYEYGLYVGNCKSARFRTVHIEGYEQINDFRGMVASDISKVVIDSLTLGYCSPTFDRTTLNPVNVTQWNILSVYGGGKIYVDTLYSDNSYKAENPSGGWYNANKTGVTNNIGYNGDSSQTRKDLTKMSILSHTDNDSLFKTFVSLVEQGGGRTHQIEVYNRQRYYELKSDGTVLNYFKQTTPTDGYWKQGDRLLGVSKTVGSYADLQCTLTGYLNPPTSNVTATTSGSFVNTLQVNQQGAFVVGDRITVSGSNRTFTVTNIYTSSGSTYFTLDINIEVQVTNAVVQYATPIFTPFNSIGSSVSDKQLTTTSATTVATLTPVTQGNFEIKIYYRVVTAATNLTITVTYTDGSGAQTKTLVSNASQAVGSYVVGSTYINATASAISVNATAGTANQVYVSASIKPE